MKKFNKFITEIIDNTKHYSYDYPYEYSKEDYKEMFNEFKLDISISENTENSILKFKKEKSSEGEIIFLIPKIELIYNFNIKNKEKIADEQKILGEIADEHYGNIIESLREYCATPLKVTINVINQSNWFDFVIVLEGKKDKIEIEGGLNFQDFLATISDINESFEIIAMEYNQN